MASAACRPTLCVLNVLWVLAVQHSRAVALVRSRQALLAKARLVHSGVLEYYTGSAYRAVLAAWQGHNTEKATGSATCRRNVAAYRNQLLQTAATSGCHGGNLVLRRSEE